MIVDCTFSTLTTLRRTLNRVCRWYTSMFLDRPRKTRMRTFRTVQHIRRWKSFSRLVGSLDEHVRPRLNKRRKNIRVISKIDAVNGRRQGNERSMASPSRVAHDFSSSPPLSLSRSLSLSSRFFSLTLHQCTRTASSCCTRTQMNTVSKMYELYIHRCTHHLEHSSSERERGERSEERRVGKEC